MPSQAVQVIFETFAQSPYRLDVDETFLERFLADRRCISSIARTFLEKHSQSNLLKKANCQLELQLGTHLFGLSTVEEHFALDLLIRTFKPRQVLEIGVFRGHTALTACRAMSQVSSKGQLTAIDIDSTATNIAKEVLMAMQLDGMATFVTGNSGDIVPTVPKPDFVFIDGDHDYEAAARDFVLTYNKAGAGALIAIHDTGSKVWGFHQDPGWLFYRVLPRLLAGKASLSWLDSMCRELTMRMISPSFDTAFKYCRSDEDSLFVATLTSADIIKGAGGLGFVLKLDDSHMLSLDDVMSQAPIGSKVASENSSKRPSQLGRAARKIANWVP